MPTLCISDGLTTHRCGCIPCSGSAILIHNPGTGAFAVSKRVSVGRAVVGSNPSTVVTNLEREAAALASLRSHPHVINYLTCYLRGEHFCIVTEYASGGTLLEAIERCRRKRNAAMQEAGCGTVPGSSDGESIDGDDARAPLMEDPHVFPSATMLRWAAQLCSALASIHAEGVMHRDVKPSNIFLTSMMDIKLGDFGLSRPLPMTSQGPFARTTCGTPYYMSPEQVRELTLMAEEDDPPSSPDALMACQQYLGLVTLVLLGTSC